jgi:hypothetical protein
LKRDLVIAGTIGLLIGAGVYASASASSEFVPSLVQGVFGITIAFAFFLLFALVEVPMMLMALRQMVRSIWTPRRLLLATFGFYVAFPSVYASAFVLLTGQFARGLVIAAVCIARFVSGVLIK